MYAEPKRLYRSHSERMIAGVCGGLGEYFGIDPTLVRLAFIVAALMGGPGLLAYVIMMIVVPEAPLEQTVPGAAYEAAPETEAEPAAEKETA